MMITVFITIFLGLQFAALTSADFCCTQPGYTKIRETGICIKLHTTVKSWSAANATCTNEKAALVIIRDQDDFDAVYNFSNCEVSLLEYSDCYGRNNIWIGGNDIDTEGEFKWWNGNAFTAWQSQQLKADGKSCDKKPDPDCVLFSLGQKRWHDRDCDYGLPFICQLL